MIARLIAQTTAWVILTAVLLFGSAGTIRWPGAWIYLVETLVGAIVIRLWLARHDPALLKERLSPLVQRKQEGWDRVLMPLIFVLWSAWLAFMALDAVRYQYSHVPAWLQAIGAVGIAASMYLGYLTFRANSFAAPVVKIQKERGHRVISSGPYRYVRHPMYAGTIPLLLGIPLLLSSWYGLALVPLLILSLGIRAVMEERALRAKLEGYTQYAARVRYRFIPWIW